MAEPARFSRRTLTGGDTTTRSDRKPYAVLDVETDGLRGELTYWTATCEHRAAAGLPPLSGSDAESLWRHVTGHNGHADEAAGRCSGREHLWWAHNGGEYDYVYLFGPARTEVEREHAIVTPLSSGTRMIGLRVTWGKHRVDLRDSFAVLPSSLRSLGDQLAPELPKGDIGLATGARFDPGNAIHRDYAARDADLLLAIMTRVRAILAETFAILPSWSAASTALRAWRSTLDPDDRYHRQRDEVDVWSRLAYYGGMVHPRDVAWHGPCTTLDVNAMYPAVMRDAGVPDGRARFVRRRVGPFPGFYRIRVTVPDSEPFTFLPYRDPAGALAWPTGTFETVVSTVELDRATERGYAVEVIAGVIFPRIVHPFRAFVDRVEALRLAGGAFGYVVKILANSLYGKFGSKPVHDEWCIALDPGPGWYPLPGITESPELFGIWRRPDAKLDAPYLLPHWAAWITAGARMRLLGLGDAIGLSNVIYTDTDSLTAEAPIVAAAIERGAVTIDPRAFGACKIEHEYAAFRALAPKVTQGVEWTGPGGTYGPVETYRAKGIPRRQVAAAFAGEAIGWQSPTAALRVMRGAPTIVGRVRRLSDIANSVAWRLRGTDVIPVHLGTVALDAVPTI